MTSLHLQVLARIATPEDRLYTYVRRLDPVMRTYYVARQSTHLLHTITYRKCYRRNKLLRDLMKTGLVAKTRIVLYTRRRVRILEVLYPTMRGDELYYRVFGQESWTQYADPDIRESRGLDEIAIDFTFRLRDLQRLQLAVKQWPQAVNIVSSAVAKTVQLLLMLGYRGYVRIRVPGKYQVRLLLLRSPCL